MKEPAYDMDTESSLFTIYRSYDIIDAIVKRSMLLERSLPPERIPSKEKLVQGQGFSEILRCGWRACRETIKKTSYAEWIQAALQRQSETPASKQDTKPPGWVIEELNKKALARATQISEKLRERFPRESEHSLLAWQDRGKKVFFQEKKPFPESGKVTRLYLHVPSATAPDAFLSLCRASAKNDGIKQAKIALNLENYQAESLFDEIDNNTLIVYVYGNNPQDVDRIMKAIDMARRAQPEAWEIPARLRAKLRERAIKELIIPIDDQIALVEQMGATSYHSGIYPAIYEEATYGGSTYYDRFDFKTLQMFFAPFRPDHPVPCANPSLRNRSRHLPALVNT